MEVRNVDELRIKANAVYHLCIALVSAVSIMEHQRLTDEERAGFDENIRDYFNDLDARGVTFFFQNLLLKEARANDCRCVYLDKMISHAMEVTLQCGKELFK